MSWSDRQPGGGPGPGTGQENSVVQVVPSSVERNADLSCEPALGSPEHTANSVPSGAAESATEDASISHGIWRSDQVAPPSSVNQSGALSSTPSPLVAGVDTQ